ncbi:MAG: flagellar hook-associated protein 3 [bacterium]|nr:flagellar hook-associated protein 3 [bacterium]
MLRKFLIILCFIIISSPGFGDNKIHRMLYQMQMSQTDLYRKHINDAEIKLGTAEHRVKSMIKILQRLRVLTVQGGHCTFNANQKNNISIEIDDLIEEMITVANAKDDSGKYIFGGHETKETPFLAVYDEGAIIRVEYRGNTGNIKRQIAKDMYITANVPGNEIFWGTNQILSSSMNASGYRSPQNQVIRIDGIEINISAGDTPDRIIDKINNTTVNVRASKGGRNNLILETIVPHQIWLENVGTGSVLTDLGLIDSRSPTPPNNIDPTVTIRGLSIFGAAMMLRDDLKRNDPELVGGRDLGVMDLALDNVLKHYSSIIARKNRIKLLQHRFKTKSFPSCVTLAERLYAFWNGWHEVSIYPEESSVREAAKERAIDLTVEIRQLYNHFNDLRGKVDKDVAARIDEIINNLNLFTLDLIDLVNEMHKDGFDLYGETNINFFNHEIMGDNPEGNYDLNNDGIEENTAIYKVSGENRLNPSSWIGINGTVTFVTNDKHENFFRIDYKTNDTINDVIKRINDTKKGIIAYMTHNGRFAIKSTIAKDDIQKNFMIRHIEDSGQLLAGMAGLLKQSGKKGAFDYRRVNDIVKFFSSRNHITISPKPNPASYMRISNEIEINANKIAAASGKNHGSWYKNTSNGVGDGSNSLRIANTCNNKMFIDSQTKFNDAYVILFLEK